MAKSKRKFKLKLWIKIIQRVAALVGRSLPTRFYTVYNGVGFVAMCYLVVTAISKSRSDNSSSTDVIHSNHVISQV
jgi:hypothetical protein